jgi:hypothetical protein
MTANDVLDAVKADQILTCTLSGLSENAPVIWIDPANNEISNTDTNNYIIDQGTYVLGNKVATLTIKEAKVITLSSGSVFKCKVRSALYPKYSPDVVKEIILNFLGLGITNFASEC